MMNDFTGTAKVAQRITSFSAQRVRRALAEAFAAFTTGARLIPLGDNGKLLESLAAKSRSLSPTDR
jgi:hypothetical protein